MFVSDTLEIVFGPIRFWFPATICLTERVSIDALVSIEFDRTVFFIFLLVVLIFHLFGHPIIVIRKIASSDTATTIITTTASIIL